MPSTGGGFDPGSDRLVYSQFFYSLSRILLAQPHPVQPNSIEKVKIPTSKITDQLLGRMRCLNSSRQVIEQSLLSLTDGPRSSLRNTSGT